MTPVSAVMSAYEKTNRTHTRLNDAFTLCPTEAHGEFTTVFFFHP